MRAGPLSGGYSKGEQVTLFPRAGVHAPRRVVSAMRMEFGRLPPLETDQRQIDKEMKCYGEVIFRNAPFMTISEDTLKEMFLEE